MCNSNYYWCTVEAEILEFNLFSQTCPEVFKTIQSKRLCQNQTFWKDRKCSDDERCSGNWPGQCAKTVIYRGRLKRQVYSFRPCFGNICKDNSQRICNFDGESGSFTEKFEECKKVEMHWCTDNSTCIHNDLICDGYVHCQDGSDEEESLCANCPRDIGYPHEKLLVATYACKHRYTGRWICSVPCDGHDDLCQDFADENCDPASKHFIALAVSLYLIIIILIGECFLKSLKLLSKSDLILEELIGETKSDVQSNNSLEKILLEKVFDEQIQRKAFQQVISYSK